LVPVRNGRSNFSFGKRNGYSSVKRIDLETETDAIISHLKHPHIHLLPNTSGARNAKKLFCGATGKRSLRNQLVKTRNSSDPKYLMPDAIETLKATEALQIRLYRFTLHSR
jgi:thiazole synthase